MRSFTEEELVYIRKVMRRQGTTERSRRVPMDIVYKINDILDARKKSKKDSEKLVD